MTDCIALHDTILCVVVCEHVWLQDLCSVLIVYVSSK